MIFEMLQEIICLVYLKVINLGNLVKVKIFFNSLYCLNMFEEKEFKFIRLDLGIF